MKLYYSDNFCKLYNGNMLDMIESGHIKPMSIDCIVTDPPYELNFMNKGWDNAGVSFSKETWKKCFDVLKPGGYLLAFGGSRTYHRIACAIEDAGFEIRDTIMWIYGSGFPKSMNLGLAIDKKNGVESEIVGHINAPDFKDSGKQVKDSIGINKRSFGQAENVDRIDTPIYRAQNEWDGWGTCLKPAFEPIIVARKPFDGSLVDNVLKYGVGGLNIDECRVPLEDSYVYKETSRAARDFASVFSEESCGYDNSKNVVASANPSGRFPANLILTYDESDYDEVCGGFPYTKSTGGSGEASKINTFANTYNGGWGHDKDCAHLGGLGDEGSASRYFYCAKASKKDRDDGLVGVKNNHPTVKPVSLISYIIRLVAPKGATVLDPFMGSGSTGKACAFENRERDADYKFIGIELTDEYLPIAEARIKWAENIEFDEDVSNTTNEETQKEVVEEENIEPVFEKFDWGI